MSCNCLDRGKLPVMNNYDMMKSIRMNMSNGESFIITVGDLVGVQFVKDDKQILLRKGRIKDIVVIAKKCLSTSTDNVSHIILDASEQFSIKLIEIKLKDIIKVGAITDKFPDYSDRITELDPNYIEGCNCGVKVPTRQGGMITEEEYLKKVTKPDKENVSKMDKITGEFDDLYDMNQNRPDLSELKVSTPVETTGRITKRGFRLTR